MSALTTPVDEPLRDQLGRPMRSLRISLTDRCNLRCHYCMPESNYDWLPKSEILSLSDILKIVEAFQKLGVSKLRLTGGEPLLRKDAVAIVEALRQNFPALELAMTTNGTLLAPIAKSLKKAGLNRLTISLDAVDAQQFFKVSRRDLYENVQAGLRAASEAQFEQLKLNAVLLDETRRNIRELISVAQETNAELRFIEYMDVGGATQWSQETFLNGQSFREELINQFGTLRELPRPAGDTAQRFQLPSGVVLGFIESMTNPFCKQCDRSRVTADGVWFHCLYAESGLNLKTWLTQSDESLESHIESEWLKRDIQGAYTRKLMGQQGQLYSLEQLRTQPHLEMHTRGG